jgi:hypothetical protein
MAKKRSPSRPPTTQAGGPAGNGMIPNVSLSRTARTGEATEDELLLNRPRHHRPEARVPARAEFTHGDPWRVLRILGEYVHGFDALAEVGAAIAVFGSARTPATDPMYEAARELGGCLASASSSASTDFARRGPSRADSQPPALPSSSPRRLALASRPSRSASACDLRTCSQWCLRMAPDPPAVVAEPRPPP